MNSSCETGGGAPPHHLHPLLARQPAQRIQAAFCCSPLEISFGLYLAMLAASWRPHHGCQGHRGVPRIDGRGGPTGRGLQQKPDRCRCQREHTHLAAVTELERSLQLIKHLSPAPHAQPHPQSQLFRVRACQPPGARPVTFNLKMCEGALWKGSWIQTPAGSTMNPKFVDLVPSRIRAETARVSTCDSGGARGLEVRPLCARSITRKGQVCEVQCICAARAHASTPRRRSGG